MECVLKDSWVSYIKLKVVFDVIGDFIIVYTSDLVTMCDCEGRFLSLGVTNALFTTCD